MKSGLRLFLSQAVDAFHSTGAICPSSGFLARAMIRPLDNRNGSRPLRVLEAGPGTGVFTRCIVGRLRPGDQLDAVELNPNFARWVRTWAEGLPTGGPGVRVFEEDIVHFEPEAPYDLVVSSLPLANFSPSFVDEVFRRLMALGRPGAWVSFFQYFGLKRLQAAFAGREKRDRLRAVSEVIHSWTARRGVGLERVWLNVPPANVYYLRAGKRI